MTEHGTASTDDVLRQVAALDPLRGPDVAADPDPSQRAQLFEAITTGATGSRTNTSPAIPPATTSGAAPSEPTAAISLDRRRNRRRRLLPGVIAATLALVIALAGLAFLRAPDAQAALTQAVERAAALDSGRVEVDVQLIDVPEPDVSGADFRIDYQFNGDDYRFGISSGGVQAMGEINVDGQNYSRFGDGLWSTTLGPIDSNDVWGLEQNSTRPEAVLTLIELADDFTTEDNAGATTYIGTIASADLIARTAELPIGVGLIVSGDNPEGELPEQVELAITVRDELLESARIDVDGPVPHGGNLTAVVVITYRDLGAAQPVSAPSPDTIADESSSALPGLPPEIAAASQILFEVDERKPGLCQMADAPGSGMTPIVVQCYVDAGEPAAAEAYQLITDYFGG